MSADPAQTGDSASRARAILAEAVSRPVGEIPDDAAIGMLEGWDSLAHIRLIAGIEAALDRPLTTEEVIGVHALDK
ncbi:MAG: hypothetical protein AAGF44_12385, partial [Pseudomonadota bacterium]